MKTARLIGNSPAGYGHRQITVEVISDNNFETISGTTNRMYLTDDITSDDCEKSKKAQIEVMKLILSANGYDTSEFEFETIEY